jgi:hypothetical protein
MSKKFKGKACAYCGGLATGPDHVIGRGFFVPADRDNLPQVHACDGCNSEKSTLETELMAVLPFGGRHHAGQATLREMVPGRLKNNQRLHRQLMQGQGRTWAEDDSGLVVPMTTLTVDAGRVLKLYEWIARGLLWFHWQVRLTDEHDITVLALGVAGEERFDRLFALRAAARVSENLKNGAFQYEGAQAGDDPSVTIWRFSMYGGIRFGDPDFPGEVATRIGVMTGPRRIKEKADRAVRFGVTRV